MNGLARLWRRLTDAPASMAEPGRRRIQLLSGLLVVLISLGLLAVLIEELRFPDVRRTFAVIAAALAMLVVAYGLARRGRFTAGALLTVGVCTAICFAILILNPRDPFAYSFLYVSMFLARLLFDRAGVWIATAVNLLGVTLLLPALGVPPPSGDPVVVPIFLVLTAVLLLLGVSFRDTAEHHQRAALAASEARMARAEAVARLGSWSWDFASNAMTWSTVAYRVCDVDPATREDPWDILARVVHPADWPRLRQTIEQARHRGGMPPVEFRVLAADGSERQVRVQRDLVRDDTGRPVGMVGTLQDISDQKRAERALRDNEHRLKEAQRLARLGSWELDLTTNQLTWSDEVYRIFEIDPAKFGASYQAFLETVHPDDRESVNRAYTESLRNRLPYEIEHRLLLADGRVKIVHERCESFFDEHGRALRSVGTVQDVTERRRAEERTLELNRLLRTISEINQMVVREHSREQLLAGTCRILVTHGEYRMAWIGLADRATGRVRPVAQSGFETGYLEDADIRCDDSPRGRGPTGTAIRENRYVIGPDSESEESIATWRERARQLGYRASAAFPLRVGGQVIGAVNVYTVRSDAFGPDEIALLDELVDDLGYALRGLQVAAALAQSETNFRSLIENANVGILVNHRGRHIFSNTTLQAMLGYSAEQMQATGVDDLVHPAERDKVAARFRERMADESVPDVYETVFMTRDRQPVPVELAATRTLWQGEAAGLVFVRDLRERRRAEAEMRKLSSAIEQAADSVIITNRGGVIEYVNPAFERTTGYSRAEAIGRNPRLVKSGKQGAAFYRKLWMTILDGEVFSDVLINRRKDGSLYYEEKIITPLKDASGQITHFVSTGRDVSERIHAQEQLQHMAQHDALTELPNRALLLDRLKQSMARARWHQRLVAVLFIDLDRFKTINDTLGHDVGDRLLQQLAERFGRCVREGDTVARFGGDEFVILLDDVASEQDVGGVAQKALDVLANPFTVENQKLYITASIGVSLFPNDGEDSGTLLKNADIAMYRAKELGKNTYQFYSSDMSARAFERLSLETSLRNALERDEFVLHYQPQIDTDTGRIVGVEALIRWQHPDLGIVPPADFIPLLEETGLIAPAGEWVLDTACKQLHAWHEAGRPDLRLAVNLSPRQFHFFGLKAAVERGLHCIGRDPGLLELEITEGVILSHTRASLDTLAALRALGVRLALDDFGTGYSSLSYLRRFPVDTLKIDRSFVQDISDDPDDSAITTTIIVLARNLKLDVIAEGVENEAQRDLLRREGCRLMQGYLFSRPLPAADITRLLEARKNS